MSFVCMILKVKRHHISSSKMTHTALLVNSLSLSLSCKLKKPLLMLQKNSMKDCFIYFRFEHRLPLSNLQCATLFKNMLFHLNLYTFPPNYFSILLIIRSMSRLKSVLSFYFLFAREHSCICFKRHITISCI